MHRGRSARKSAPSVAACAGCQPPWKGLPMKRPISPRPCCRAGNALAIPSIFPTPRSCAPWCITNRASVAHDLNGRPGTWMGVQRSLGLLALFDYTFRVRARLHRFLLMVLMLALPVQAFAYSGMLACLFPDQGE